jgi:hypothetical protein
VLLDQQRPDQSFVDHRPGGWRSRHPSSLRYGVTLGFGSSFAAHSPELKSVNST